MCARPQAERSPILGIELQRLQTHQSRPSGQKHAATSEGIAVGSERAGVGRSAGVDDRASSVPPGSPDRSGMRAGLGSMAASAYPAHWPDRYINPTTTASGALMPK